MEMKKRLGFTLIELLVVIAIIALLMAVLMPALTRVRKQAKAVVCQTRLKQWGLYFAMYSDENNGFFHPGYSGVAGAESTEYNWCWTLRRLHKHNYKFWLCPIASKPVMLKEGAPYGPSSGAPSPPLISGLVDGVEFFTQVCLDRHDGFTNMLFMDYSVRKVGLRSCGPLNGTEGMILRRRHQSGLPG